MAIATRDLDARTILRAGDFQIKTMTVEVGSSDAQFNLVGKSLDNWALKHGAGEFMDFAGITGGAGQR
ncbi:hypothetical protein DMB90_08645 [Raoultella planticola]|uniref:Uncharacterized protein n=1 Tax=Raoultella planticola TaxID=575 RepID=A0A5P6A9H8_RAOPL|nr:hypothetical protein DMB90_08645 [Raoultella planticola]